MAEIDAITTWTPLEVKGAFPNAFTHNAYTLIIGRNNARNVYYLFPIETPKKIVKIINRSNNDTVTYHYIDEYRSGNTIWGEGMFNNATNIKFEPKAGDFYNWNTWTHDFMFIGS